tara:strand:+ start:45 stop:425 length:381 start_codon:yes stop_codon:yes gene_type:complete
LGHIVGHPLMGNTPEVRMFLGANRDQLKQIKNEVSEIHPMLEQQVAVAHSHLDPSKTDHLNAVQSSDWCNLYDRSFLQRERLLSRIARAASSVADKCDDIENHFQLLGESFSTVAEVMVSINSCEW